MAFFNRTLTFLDLYFLQFNYDVLTLFGSSLAADDAGQAAKGANIALNLAGRGLFNTGVAVGGTTAFGVGSPFAGGIDGSPFPGSLQTASIVGGTLPGAAFYGNSSGNISLSNQYKSTFRFSGAPLTAGLRDVSGNQNNLLDPNLGSTLAVLPRLLHDPLVPLPYVKGTGGFTSGNKTNSIIPSGSNASTAWDTNYAYNYGVRGGTIYDANVRLISNLVADSNNTISKGILRYTADPINVGKPGVVGLGATATTDDPTLALKRGLNKSVAVENPVFERLVIDNPHAVEWTNTGTQAGTRVNPVTGAVNPLRNNAWFNAFGQFFDHGLDFEAKGQDGKVVAPLMPSDPLYQKALAFYNTNIAPFGPPFATPADQALAAAKYASNALSQVRSNTIDVNIGIGSTDSLLVQLGLTESNGFKPGGVVAQGGLLAQANADALTTTLTTGGTLVLNGQIISFTAGQSFADIAAQLNKLSTLTGVSATSGGSFFSLIPVQGGAFNRDSTMVDLSQVFGNVFSQTVFLKAYNADGTTTGKLLTHDPVLDPTSLSTLATWADIKANALTKLGLTLHDYNVGDVPLVEVDPSVTGAKNLRFVALDVVSGTKVYLTDTADSRLQTTVDNSTTPPTSTLPTLVLAKAGVSFLDDISPYAGNVGGLNVDHPDAPNTAVGIPGDQGKTQLYWLNHHFVSGDGRANENIGLSAIHEIFNKFMNANVDSIAASYAARLAPTVNGAPNPLYDPNTSQLVAPTGEQLFQEAKILSEATYQHFVFATFVRRFSPNIAGFVASDVTVDAGITQEFANAVYRVGHSQVGNNLDALKNNAGIVDRSPAGDVSIPLVDGFLNPLIYTNTSSAELSAGSLGSASYNTDEFVENTLRNNLLGAGLDLAAFNIMRGRDNALPTLNEARRRFTDQLSRGLAPGLGGSTNPGAAAIFALIPTLRPYTSWQDFKDHLLNPSSAKQFIEAYARDTVLLAYGAASGTPLSTSQLAALPADSAGKLAFWGNLQASTVAAEAATYQKALDFAAGMALLDPAFMGANNFANPKTNGNQEFEKIDLWIGGLAEAKAVGGMLGTTFDAIFASQMQKEQEGDRFYYLPRVGDTDWFIDQVDSKSFIDIIADATGLKHLYADPFSVNDSNIELSQLPATTNTTQIRLANGTILPANSSTGLIPNTARFVDPLAGPPIAGAGISNNNLTNYLTTHPLINPTNTAGIRGFLGNSAGWVRTAGSTVATAVYTFFGNPGNYTDSEGVLNFNGAGHSSEMIAGTAGVDRINGGDGNETLYGDGGNDILEGGLGNDYLFGGDGNDTITDALVNGGDDFINGGAGADTITAGDGIDTVFGDDGNDNIRGGNGADALHGGAGNDLMYGDNGVVTGVGANASMDPLGDADAMTGGEGNDTLYGGGGIDALSGGIGSDLLIGGAGADTFACGLDNDVDTVWFDTAPVNGTIDTITEFTVGGIVPGYTANDQIRISRAVFAGGTAALGGVGGLAATAFQYTDAVANPLASTATVRFLYNQTNGALWYDQDGRGAIAAQQIATLGAYDPLNPNDPTAMAPVLRSTNFNLV